MRDTGLSQAQRIQAEAPDMSGTELYAEEQYVPDFKAAVALHNMLERKAENISLDKLQRKADVFMSATKAFAGYTVSYKGLSMDDM